MEGLSVHDFVTPLVPKLKVRRSKLPRVMIFCRRFEDCSILYQLFLNQLKNELTEPIGASNVSRFRLVDMYTSVTDKEVQDCIITSFCKSDTQWRRDGLWRPGADYDMAPPPPPPPHPCSINCYPCGGPDSGDNL